MFPPVFTYLLLLTPWGVPVVSCAAVGPAVDVFLPLLLHSFIPGVPSEARVSAVAAFPTAVEVSSVTGVSKI